jgi:hypothetical protein
MPCHHLYDINDHTGNSTKLLEGNCSPPQRCKREYIRNIPDQVSKLAATKFLGTKKMKMEKRTTKKDKEVTNGEQAARGVKCLNVIACLINTFLRRTHRVVISHDSTQRSICA